MIQFYKEYPQLSLILPQAVAKFDPNNSEQSAKIPGETQIVQQAVSQLPDSTTSRRSGAGQDALKGQQPVADIHGLVCTLSWTVNILLIQKVKDTELEQKWEHINLEEHFSLENKEMSE